MTNMWKHLGLSLTAIGVILVWIYRADVRLPLLLLLVFAEATMLLSAARRKRPATIISASVMAGLTFYVLYAFSAYGTVVMAIVLAGGLCLLLYPNERHA